MSAKTKKGVKLSANSGKLERPIVVAQIVKSYNTNGEVVVKLTNDLLEDLKKTEPVFIYFDELPVPFFIEKFSTKGNSGATIKFTTVNTIERSEELVKRKIYIEASSASQEALEELAQDDMGAYLSGFTLVNGEGKTVGTISNYFDYPNNPCIEVILADGVKSPLLDSDENSEPVLLPFQEQLIMVFDPQECVIQMSIPAGLIIY